MYFLSCEEIKTFIIIIIIRILNLLNLEVSWMPGNPERADWKTGG